MSAERHARMSRNLEDMFDGMRTRNLRRHDKVTRRMPFEVSGKGLLLGAYPTYTDTVGEHFVVLEMWRLFVPERFQEPKVMHFPTTAWVRFLRGMGASGSRPRPFCFRSRDTGRNVYFEYECVLRRNRKCVQLSMSIVDDLFPDIECAEEKSRVMVRIPFPLWYEFRHMARQLL